MKRMILIVVAFAAAFAGAATGGSSVESKLAANTATIPLAEARSRIGKAIASPAVMTQIMKHLSPADQVTFVGDVNAAIAKMPGKPEVRAAKALSVNRAALNGASKGNLSKIVSEVFATAPVEALPVISENFAETAFNQASDPAHTYSDAQFLAIAQKQMASVVERCTDSDHGDVRSTMAALMFVRASNNQTPELKESMIATLPASAQKTAREEWAPSALAKGDAKSYEPMMAAADAGESIDNYMVLRIAGEQNVDAMLQDLIGDMLNVTQTSVTDAVVNYIAGGAPKLSTGGVSDAGGGAGGGAPLPSPAPTPVAEEEEPTPTPEPKPYQWQQTR